MLIFSTITPRFRSLVDNWLAPSLERLGMLDRLVVLVDHADTARGNGNFRSAGFDAHVVNKLQFIADRADSGNAPFLVTDADIVYLRPCDELLAGLLDGKDILLAREYPDDAVHYNIGQMVIRPSLEVAGFFRRMAADLRDGQAQARYRRDQPANQDYINVELSGSVLRHAPLPETFANTGLLRHLGDQAVAGFHSYHATETFPEAGVTSLEKKHRQLAGIVSRSGVDFSGDQGSISKRARQEASLRHASDSSL